MISQLTEGCNDDIAKESLTGAAGSGNGSLSSVPNKSGQLQDHSGNGVRGPFRMIYSLGVRRSRALGQWLPFTLLGLACVAPREIGGQAPRRAAISDSISCPRCQIQLTREFLVGKPESGGYPSSAMIDFRGQFWIISESIASVYSPAGTPAREIRLGDAGSPHSAAMIVPAPGDSVFAVDADHPRGIVIHASGPVGRRVHFPFPGSNGLILRWPDRVLISGLVSTEESVGYPLHELSLIGDSATLTSSFGPDGGDLVPGASGPLRLHLTTDTGGGFWTADVGRYRMLRWSSTRSIVDSIVRQARWFPGNSHPSIGGPRQAPNPMIVAIQRDQNGFLWVCTRVPREDWRPAWPEIVERLAEVSITPRLLRNLYTTVIEVIDPANRTLIAQHTVDELALALLPGGRLLVDAAPRGSIDVVLKVKVFRLNR